MKKTTTRARVASASKATKTTKTSKTTASKAATKTTKPTRSRTTTASVTKKKAAAAKPKGPLHHVKRLYHLTPKFVHGMVVGAVIGLGLVTYVGTTGTAEANPQADKCIKTMNGIYIENNRAKADVKLDDGCGIRKLVMKVYTTDSVNGLPRETQRIHNTSGEVEFRTRDSNWKTISADMPAGGCFYQADLVDVTEPKDDDEKYPMVEFKLGGSRNCNPTPSYACANLHATVGANRTVVIDQFNYRAQYATFTRASINWGDGSNPSVTANVTNSSHPYPKDGSYTLSVTAYFNITARNGQPKEKVAQACTFPITITTTTTPGQQSVCELKTGKIVTIPEGTYDTTVYGPTNAKECNPTVTPPTDTPTPDNPTPTSTLVKTGPSALIVVFILALVGGFVFHHGHRHVKSKKHNKHAS